MMPWLSLAEEYCNILNQTKFTANPSHLAFQGAFIYWAGWMKKLLVRTRVWCGGGVCLVILDSCCHGVCCSHSCFCSIKIGFFLKLPYILLVPDSLIAKPVGYLLVGRRKGENSQASDSVQQEEVWSLPNVKFGSIKYTIPSLQSNIHWVLRLIKQ